MHLNLLGSGGAVSFPRPCCECKLCEKARKQGPPYTRTGPSLYCYDEAVLFDTPDEICYQLEREKIKKVDHIFYTHWHPDHTQGARLVEHKHFGYMREPKRKPTNIYIPDRAYLDFEKFVPQLFYWQKQYDIKIHKIKDRKSVRIGKVSVTPINFFRSDRERFAYLIEEGDKRVMYAPCSVFEAKIDRFWKDLDVLIMELGWFGNTKALRAKGRYPVYQDHISFEENIELVKLLKPRKTILTHIEGTRHITLEEVTKAVAPYKKLNVSPAIDGMHIRI